MGKVSGRLLRRLAALAVLSAWAAPAPAASGQDRPLVATQEGDLPIILSAPHGGTREIPGVPPRKGEGLKKGPSGFVTARDGGVEELAHEIAAALRERTGKKPFLVAASFHRRYLDCNRPPDFAYEHDGAKAVYEEYHGALARYCAAAAAKFGGGLVVDLHGQGSARDKVFRGTQNGRTNALMRERFGEGVHVGPGSLMGMLKARGWAVHPEGDGPEQDGFRGGHIVQVCGRRERGTDAVQLEFGSDFRGAARRKEVAATMAEVLAEIAKLYTGEKKPPAAAPAGDKPVVGFLMVDADKHFVEERKHSPCATRLLEPNGFRFGLAEWRRFFGDRAEENATLDLLRRFHVMVIDTPFDSSIVEIGPRQKQAAAAARRALERYVEEGGGALVILQAVRYPGDKDQDYANLVLEGLGLRMLHEGVFDPRRSFKAPIASIFPPEGFFRTENVAAGHPLSEGVRRLCLPQYHNGQTPGVVAFSLSPEWQAVVRGEEDARSFAVTREHVTDYRTEGAYGRAPPIVAARTFGKGRVAAWSVPARSVYLNTGVPGWNMIVERTGDAAAGLPSDGGRLFLNCLKWLAEPALANPALGTFKAGAEGSVRFPAGVDFDKRPFTPPSRGVRGILGARTALSDGAGSVAEHAQAARAAGLSFIVFNEPIEKMTAAKLERLKADCKQASAGDFYACPGVEFGDELGCRWALWGERVVFPPEKFDRAYGETGGNRPALRQWDGEVMHNPGQYWEYCGYAPNMLLTYRRLRAAGAHPANMWWVYRVPPFVRDGNGPVEDQLDEWLYALRDVRHSNPASYTRVRSPSEVAAAAAACATVCRDLASARDWLNTRCGNFFHPAQPYVTSGPVIEQWAAVNTQHDWPLDVRGKQRVRLRFSAGSPDGLREVKVHNADTGLVRRYLGHGRPALAEEFELVHDRDRALVLEVVDTKGRRAVSDKIYLFCYKTSLFRCGDNLNFLGGIGLCWHPDRNEMLNLAQDYQGMPVESIAGYDTSSALTSRCSLHVQPIDSIRTAELRQYPQMGEHGVLRKILDVKLPGNDVKICDMSMGPLVEGFDSPTRDTPARTSVPAAVRENALFTREHRAWYLQNRNNMFVTWDHRRPREGAERYRGGLVFHEGRIVFKRDATLEGSLPVMLFYFSPRGDPEGTATTAFVKDARGGPAVLPLEKGRRLVREGDVAPGGWVTAGPCDVQAVFYAPSDGRFRYAVVSQAETGRVNQLQVGLGEGGRKVKAGEELRYRFAMATLGGARLGPGECAARLDAVGDGFGLGGGDRGARASFQAGSPAGREMFFTVRAEGGEAKFKVEPRPTIVDLPICLEGVEDNGCVAVHSSARPWFRWVGVAEGRAWFQEDVDAGSEIWAGNVFACDRKEIRLTLVREGLGEGTRPWLEVHNPADEPIEARIASPRNAPVYGGLEFREKIPAGSSIRIPLGTR